MKAPKAPAIEPRPKWWADASRSWTQLSDSACRFWAVLAIGIGVRSSIPDTVECQLASRTRAKSVKPKRPEGWSSEAKWKRISASIGVNCEKRVRRAASLRKSTLVILPSPDLLMAVRMISSTRSISLIMFWKARTFA